MIKNVESIWGPRPCVVRLIRQGEIQIGNSVVFLESRNARRYAIRDIVRHLKEGRQFIFYDNVL